MAALLLETSKNTENCLNLGICPWVDNLPIPVPPDCELLSEFESVEAVWMMLTEHALLSKIMWEAALHLCRHTWSIKPVTVSAKWKQLQNCRQEFS